MKKVFFLLISICCFTLVSHSQQKKVMVMEIKSEIDPPMKRYVQLALRHATTTEADLILIEMDTYGGTVMDAKEIVDMLMNTKTPVWVFINSDAASAGALISIACDSIYMAPGATIGAATVVDASGERAPDKYQAYMRSIMRATAEENGRDPKIAEGMVDENVELPEMKKPGQVISFSTSEAIKYGYCEAKVDHIDQILERNNLKGAEVERFELGAAESIIAFFLNPFISGLLILCIIGGIYFEMQTPGMGFAGLAALVALILYLVPYYLNGLAAYWEIIAFFIGIILIALEVFVIPGFGVAGIFGIVTVIGSLVLIMINNNAFDFDFVSANDILYALAAALSGLLGGGILLLVLGSRIHTTRFYSKVALMDTQDSNKGFTVNAAKGTMIGKKGVSYTVLRPSGKVLIDGKIYDAYTRGDFIERGTSIEVLGDDGGTLKVKVSE